MDRIAETFKTKHPVIGMVHFAPLIGYKDHPGIEAVLRHAKKNVDRLLAGGVDAIMFENNYDIPHKEFVDANNAQMIMDISIALTKNLTVPHGYSILWNDYKTALEIAKKTGGSFIRVPVFVDSVKTSYGTIQANPKNVLQSRSDMNAEHIMLFTDIHVKHATMLSKKTVTESAQKAVAEGSDGIIITGKWTADMPTLTDLDEARTSIGEHFPLLIGSGATPKNVTQLLTYASGIIVGTALKEGSQKSKEEEINIKPWEKYISTEKTTSFMNIVRLHVNHST